MGTNNNRVRTGNMTGGHMGTRQHPDAAEERLQTRRTILNAGEELVGEGDELPVETAVAIVAPGHTVEAPVPGQKKFVGYDKNTGLKVFGPVYETFGPGSEVTLPVDEIARLRGLAFLVDPRKAFKTQKDVAMSMAQRPTGPKINYSNA